MFLALISTGRFATMVLPGRVIGVSVLIGLAACWLVALAPASGRAEVFVIEAAVPLEDASDEGVSAALDSALESAVRRAATMGLTWVEIHSVFARDGLVGVQVLAASEPPENARGGADSEDAPGTGAAAQPTSRERIDL
jgi:hypothetical protein